MSGWISVSRAFSSEVVLFGDVQATGHGTPRNADDAFVVAIRLARLAGRAPLGVEDLVEIGVGLFVVGDEVRKRGLDGHR